MSAPWLVFVCVLHVNSLLHGLIGSREQQQSIMREFLLYFATCIVIVTDVLSAFDVQPSTRTKKCRQVCEELESLKTLLLTSETTTQHEYGHAHRSLINWILEWATNTSWRLNSQMALRETLAHDCMWVGPYSICTALGATCVCLAPKPSHTPISVSLN